MKYIVLTCFVFMGLSGYTETFDLTISIPNLKNQDGEIQIGIYNTAETFPHVDKQYRVVIIDVSRFSGTYTIKDLPGGEYAVALMHDENKDKILNTGFLGIPKEGYGFSNNIRPLLSSPSFKDCKIALNRNMKITINLIY